MQTNYIEMLLVVNETNNDRFRFLVQQNDFLCINKIIFRSLFLKYSIYEMKLVHLVYCVNDIQQV